MTLRLYWDLTPVSEPARGETSPRNGPALVRERRLADPADLHAQIVRAAGLSGFDGLLAPSEAGGDSQISAAAVAGSAPHLLLVPQLPASLAARVATARRSIAFQRPAQRRPGWTLISEGTAIKVRGPEPFPGADLNARTEEFLRVARGLAGDPRFSFEGRFFQVEDGGFTAPLDRLLFPPVFARGEATDALEISARAADVHLFAPAPPEALRHRITTLARLAMEEDRRLHFGVVATIAARASDEEAARAGPADIAGSYDVVAGKLADMCAAGVGHIVLGARPAAEEIYRIGRFVVPRLRARVIAGRATRRRISA